MKVLGSLLSIGVALASSASVPVHAQAATGVVISQFAGRGPSGSNDDFVEIVNAGSTPVDVSGWTLQTCFGSSGSPSVRGTINETLSLQPGQYFLFANTISDPGYSLGVPPDAPISSGVADFGTGQFNGLAGIRLVDAAGNARDMVGSPPGSIYPQGSPCAEGTGIFTPTTTGPNTALFRRTVGGVLQDANDNATDFPGPATAGAPRNSGRPTLQFVQPSSRRFNEAGGTLDVQIVLTAAATSPVTVQLLNDGDEDTAAYGIDYTITLGGVTVAPGDTITFAPGERSKTIRLTGIDDRRFERNEQLTLILGPVTGAIPGTLNRLAITIIDDDPQPPPIGPRIYEIQGSSHVSPLAGQAVTNVPGIVTAVAADGFYMQDSDGDGDQATSDGIFVATGTAPAVNVNDEVLVSGQVSEIRAGAANLSVTEITAPTVAAGFGNFQNATVTPVPLGVNGRVPPVRIIDDDSAGNVESSSTTVFDPDLDGLDFYESLEGMRVEIDDARVVGPTSAAGVLWVVGDSGNGASGIDARGSITVVADAAGVDYNPERIQLAGGVNGITAPATANVGDSIAVVRGVMSYEAGNYKVRLTEAPALVSGGLQPGNAAAATGADRLSIAAFQLANLAPGDGARIARVAAQIRNGLGAPDIVSLGGIEDNSGPANDGTVAADATIRQLTDAIVAAGGPRYSAVQIDPLDGADGGPAGANVRVVQLYNAARVTLVAGSNGAGNAGSATAASFVGGRLVLSLSPGRVAPAGAAFANSRKPLAVSYDFNGRRVIVVANHFVERDADQPLFGVNQPPAFISEAQRRQQAGVVHDFVSGALALDPAARIVVLGDLNDFGFSAPLSILRNGSDGNQPALRDLGSELIPAAAERYSAIVDGNAKDFDHILVTPALDDSSAAFQIVHFNSEFANGASPRDGVLAAFTVAANQAPVARAVVNPATAGGGVPVQLDGGTSTDIDGRIVSYRWLQTVGTAVTLANADTALASFTTPATTRSDQVLSFSLTVTDDQGATDSTSVTVTISATAADTTPDAFGFTAANGVEPRSVQTSNTVTIAGIDAAAQVNVSNGSYSINGGSFITTAGTVVAGDTLRLRVTASSNFAATITATLIVGGVSADYNVTTRAANTTPTPFGFAPVTGADPGATVTSGSIVVTSIEGPSPISIANGEYSINNGPFTRALVGAVNNADVVRVRVVAANGFLATVTATLTIGGIDGDFSVTTRGRDITPEPFNFAPATGAEPGAPVTSASIIVAGIEGGAPIIVADGLYSINGAPFTSAASTVDNGDAVRVQRTAAAGFGATAVATLTIGGVGGTFSVTTRGGDTAPDAFVFTPVGGAALLAVVTSNGITVSGLETATPISIVNGLYSINDRPFTSPVALVNNGDTVRVQQTASNTPSTTTVTTLTIGTVSADFRVTTAAAEAPSTPGSGGNGGGGGGGGGGAINPLWLLPLLVLRRWRRGKAA